MVSMIFFEYLYFFSVHIIDKSHKTHPSMCNIHRRRRTMNVLGQCPVVREYWFYPLVNRVPKRSRKEAGSCTFDWIWGLWKWRRRRKTCLFRRHGEVKNWIRQRNSKTQSWKLPASRVLPQLCTSLARNLPPAPNTPKMRMIPSLKLTLNSVIASSGISRSFLPPSLSIYILIYI